MYMQFRVVWQELGDMGRNHILLNPSFSKIQQKASRKGDIFYLLIELTNPNEK